MSESQSGSLEHAKLEHAKAALLLARAYCDGAMLAARHKPHDAEVLRRAQNAVQQGENAWKDYVRAVTAASGVQNMQAPPSTLLSVPSLFCEE